MFGEPAFGEIYFGEGSIEESGTSPSASPSPSPAPEITGLETDIEVIREEDSILVKVGG